MRARLSRVMAEGHTVFEIRQRTGNDEPRDIQISARCVDIGGHCVVVCLSQDITERKRSIESLRTLSRALRTVGEGNKVLVRASDETELLDDICNVLVDMGGYKMAWVGYIQDDADKTLKPVATCGEDGGFVESLQIKCADDKPVCCNIAGAYQLARPVSVGDVTTDQDSQAYRADAVERGFISSIALPLKDEHRVFGILTIFADKPHAFNAEEIMLLEEMASDLAYGILAIRSGKERDQAQHALQASEERLRTIISREADGVIVLDKDLKVQFANPAAGKLLGRKDTDLTGKEFGFPVVPEETTEIDILRPDASMAIAEMRVVDTEWGGAPAHVVSLHDITERQLLEQEREQSLEQRQAALVQTIKSMAVALEKRDPYTAGHQHRVAQLSTAIAGQLGLDEDQIEGILLGTMIHDLGKIYVPSEILNRPGRLTHAEFEIIKTHSQVGYDIVKDIDFPWPVAQMILQHHEKLDGSGYPNGLKGDEILLEARIIVVADIVEAMSSHRPYRPALGMEAAIEEISKQRGKTLDADVVDACVRLVNENGFRFDSQ
jgi:putative nucleotidyltransferase with HDIG domain